MTGAERAHPPRECTALLDAVAAKIGPDDAELGPWFENYAREHRARLAGDLALMELHAPMGARVLEVGAVPLLLTGALVERGWNVRAVDVAPERFGRATRALGLDVARCDIESEALPFEDAAFDFVLFNELFEHLRIDPIFTLSEVLRVLAPGGTLCLSTPNLRSFRGIKNLVLHNQGHAASAGVYRQYEKLARLGHMGHVREYTTFEVIDFVSRVGFEPERVVYRGGHGRGLVGLGERLIPSLRPFFTLLAKRPAGDPRG